MEQALTGTDANRVPEKILDTQSADFAGLSYHSPFQFSHHLAEHELFQLDRLVQLARFVSDSEPQTVFNHAAPPVSAGWHGFELKSASTLLRSIQSIETSNSWILLKGVQRDPAYARLLDQIIQELDQSTTQNLQTEITWLDAYIYIASPHAITPYHMDHAATFLLQIMGNREANLFNGNDPQILTTEEIEQYYTIRRQDALIYSDDKQKKASVYQLRPGLGVHHPPKAPHWYQNGNQFSVALGIHYYLRNVDQQAKIYQVNHYLRELGFEPTAPDRSRWQNYLKILLIDLLSNRHPRNKDEALRSGAKRLHQIMVLRHPKALMQRASKKIKNSYSKILKLKRLRPFL